MMIDERPRADTPPYWTQSGAARPGDGSDSALRRFLGGSPFAVILKLAVTSLIVGALLMWLNIRPADVFEMLREAFDRLWSISFDALRNFGNYIVAGAAIVLPVWLIARVLSYRSPR